MTLGRKTLAIVTATIIGAVLIAYAASSRIMLSSFSILQREDTSRNVRRALGALRNDLNMLSTITGDWGRWNDTYQFVVDRNQNYIKNNMITITFTELRLDHIIYLDTVGRIVYAAGYDLSKRRPIPASSPVNQQIADMLRSIPTAVLDGGISGLVIIDHMPTMLAAYPILTSTGAGPSRGTLVMGRHLDAAEIRYLEETARMSVGLQRVDDPNAPADYRAALGALRKEPVHVRFVNATRSVGYALLRDILDKPAVILRVDTPSGILAEGKASLRWLLISMLTVGILFAAASVLAMHKIVMARLSKISTGVKDIGRTGDLSARLEVTGRDELSDVAGTVNWMLESLGKARDELEARVDERTAELAQARESLQTAFEREHRIAEALQKALIEDVETAGPGYEIAARFQPASATQAEVGGDFYDVFGVPGNRLAVVIGDVSGKGIAAAVFTAMAKYMLRAYAHENPRPEYVMRRLNDALCDYTPEDMFITIFFGILDWTAGTFSYASAGHDYPLLYSGKDDAVTELEVTGPAVGNASDMTYESRTLRLLPGDVLMLYTDGITDARDGGPPMGIERLSEAFEAAAGCECRRIVDAAFDAASEAGRGNWPDDAAVMVIRIGEEWGGSEHVE